MLNIKSLISILLVLRLVSQNEFYQNQDNEAWLTKTYGINKCFGNRQSPIKIPRSSLYSCNSKTIKIEFTENELKSKSDPKNAFLTFLNFGKLKLKDNKGQIINYEGFQMHIHAPAEHVIDDKIYKSEMHLVFKIINSDINKTTDHLVVLGFFFDIAEEINEFVDDWIFNGFRNNGWNSEKVIESSFGFGNFKKLFSFDDNGGVIDSYYYYMGSLTTPNCDEIVNLFVFEEPIYFDVNQFMSLYKVFENTVNSNGFRNGDVAYGNNRSLQNLNGRDIHKGSLIGCNEGFDYII